MIDCPFKKKKKTERKNGIESAPNAIAWKR